MEEEMKEVMGGEVDEEEYKKDWSDPQALKDTGTEKMEETETSTENAPQTTKFTFRKIFILPKERSKKIIF